MKPILIIKTGQTALEVLRDYGDYDRWFTDALSGHGLAFDVRDATRAAIPDRLDHAGVIVTGSVKSAYHREAWMAPLEDLLRRADRLAIPFLCVCFGCQILAQARGGRVVLNPRGWEIGAVDVSLTPGAREDRLFAGLPSPLQVLATHQDRVETMPPGAVHLAGNEVTPVQAFRVGRMVWGVQFHPEATTAILDRLIRLRRETLERDLLRRGVTPDGHVGRILAGLSRFDATPDIRLLDRFIGICRAG